VRKSVRYRNTARSTLLTNPSPLLTIIKRLQK
jgi:hypothetical protein